MNEGEYLIEVFILRPRKFSKTVWQVLVLIGFLTCASFFSQSSFANSLTFEEALEKFVRNSSVIAAERARRESAAQRVNQAYSAAFPSVSLEGAKVKQKAAEIFPNASLFSPEEIYAVGLVLEQPLFLGGRIWNGLSLAKVQSLAAEEVERLKVNEQAFEFAKRVLDISKLKAQLKVLKGSEKIQAQVLAASERNRRRGNLRSFEYSQARAAALSYPPRIRGVELQIQKLEENLKVDLGLEQVPEILWPKAREKVFSEKLESAVSRSRNLRADVRIGRSQLRAAELNKSVNSGAHWPQLSLRGEWGYQSVRQSALFDDPSKNSKITLALQIPLFSGLSSVFERRSDQAQISAAELELRNIERKTRIEVSQAIDSFHSALKVLNEVRAWDQAATLALKQGEKSYRIGVIDTFQLGQLQAGREASALQFFDAQSNHILSWMALQVALGNDLYQAN